MMKKSTQTDRLVAVKHRLRELLNASELGSRMWTFLGASKLAKTVREYLYKREALMNYENPTQEMEASRAFLQRTLNE
jgi:O-succinylbenzoate synthase